MFFEFVFLIFFGAKLYNEFALREKKEKLPCTMPTYSLCGHPGKTGDVTLRKDERKDEFMKKKNEQELDFLMDMLSASKEDEGKKEFSGENVTDAQSQKEEPRDKEAEFEKLIKGEFKEQFEQRIQNNLKRRFKESSEAKAKNELNEQIVKMLMAKYLIPSGDTQDLIKAIESDGAVAKKEAGTNGIEADALERIRQLEYENKTIKENLENEKKAQQMEKTLSRWIKDGEYLKENYPDFNLETEAENPRFLKLLKGGADLKEAYLAMHHDEIIKTLVEKAVREAKQEAFMSARARDMRPSENGMSSNSTALFKTDVSKLTPSQRAEIAKRASRGETISF